MLLDFLAGCKVLEDLRIDLPRVSEYGEGFRALHDPEFIGKRVPSLPSLMSFAACVASEAFNLVDRKFIPNSAAPLAGLLRSWHERSPPSAQLKNVTLFVHGYVNVPSGAAADALHFSQIAKNYVDDIRSSLHSCIYDEAICPTGFTLETTLLDTNDVDYASPLVDARDRTGDISWTS